MTPNLEELESLLFDWDAGHLDSDGVARVREILRTDQAAQTWYVQQQVLSAALKLDADAGVSEFATNDAANTSTTNNQVHAAKLPEAVSNPRRWNWVAIAAGLLICVLTGRVLYLESHTDTSTEITGGDSTLPDRTDEATSRGIALVTRLVDIEWDAQQTPLQVGDALTPGPFRITSGYAQIEFFCGATVVVESPAELDLKSPLLARVHHGQLRAQVPPAARGFSLEVDDLTVVDLGTEFGLSVTPDGADVQVFDGEIELHGATKDVQSLTTGQAVSRSGGGTFAKSELTPDRFLGIEALELQARKQRAARFERWKSASDELRRDPRLIAYYAFDQNEVWQRRLRSSREPSNTELDGAIVGARRVNGRWSGKSGLEFKQPGDRVRVQIDGDYSSLTFASWVRIDSLDRRFNSLFLTDNYNLGEPHWQILETGQLYFSVRPSRRNEQGPRDHKMLSAPFWEPSMSGKWLHLATTYDVNTAMAVHYLNGAVLHTETIPPAQLVKTTRIGAASIGNWSSPTMPNSEFAIRNLNGTMDEFCIFAAALTSDEIMEMYEYGQP